MTTAERELLIFLAMNLWADLDDCANVPPRSTRAYRVTELLAALKKEMAGGTPQEPTP